jgi:hypothetical protein
MTEVKRKRKKSTIIVEGSDKPKAKKERHYVDNDKFFDAMVERRKEIDSNKSKGLPPPPVSEFIGECILKISQNLAKSYSFSQAHLRGISDELVSDAVINCLKYVDNFDQNITKNPFSYFTQISYYSFLRTIDGEEEEKAKKYKATLEKAATGMLADTDEDISELTNMDVSIKNMETFVNKYDEKLRKNSEEARKRRLKKKKEKKGIEIFLEDEEAPVDE